MLLLDKALIADPNLAIALYNKAVCMAMMSDASEALSCLASAVRIDPTMATIAKTDDDLLYIRNLPQFSIIIG